ncbi:MAG: hypothetical protein ACJ74Z_10700 [Bryobacteraceae bacterium]
MARDRQRGVLGDAARAVSLLLRRLLALAATLRRKLNGVPPRRQYQAISDFPVHRCIVLAVARVHRVL